jgi:PKD repeat protein
MPTISVKIYRIQAVDPIDILGEADWYYKIEVWNGKELVEKAAYAKQQNKDDVIENEVYSFQEIAVTETSIYIYLYDDDGIFGFETADISGSGRSYFSCTYDLKQNTFTGDQVIVEAGYYKTSGDYDDSVATDENDANLWFAIWDNYDPPKANAGPDQTCYSGDKVNFDGAQSTANGSNIIKYEWDFENDGIIDAEGQKTSYTYPAKGQFTAVLKVTDNLGEWHKDTCTIYVLNRAPIASFTYSPRPPAAPNPSIQDVVNFEDTSIDLDGTIVSWLWDFGDGQTSTDRNPRHQYADKGNYNVQLSVTDNDYAENWTTLTITIRNLPPTANFTYSPSSPKEGDDVQFTDMSTDPEGKSLSCLWNFGDGYTSEQRDPVHGYAEAGEYIITLTVTDDEGATHTVTKTITVIQNFPPVADFTYSPTSPKVGDNVQFTDSSSDPEGKGLTSWLWDFGNGDTSTLKSPTHKYQKAGQYVVNLTVTDDVGATTSTTKIINVRETPLYEQQWFPIAILIIIVVVVAIAVVTKVKRKKPITSVK